MFFVDFDVVEVVGFCFCLCCYFCVQILMQVNVELIVVVCCMIEDVDVLLFIVDLVVWIGFSCFYFYCQFKVVIGMMLCVYVVVYCVDWMCCGFQDYVSVIGVIYDVGFNFSSCFYVMVDQILGMVFDIYCKGGVDSEICFVIV